MPGLRRRRRDRIGDVSCEPLHKSRVGRKSECPPALPTLTGSHPGRLIASTLFSISSAHSVIRQCWGCCSLRLKNKEPD